MLKTTIQGLLSRAAPVAVLAASLLVAHCAPEHARALREERMVTVGYPGATVRPSGRIGVGITFAGYSNAKSTIDTSKTGTDSLVLKADDANPDQRRVSQSYSAFSPQVQFFPSDSSAFFVGAGATISNTNYSFAEQRSDGLSLADSHTDIKYQSKANYLDVPVGWAWIWGTGFSLTLDLGPRIRLSRTTTLTRDGSADQVDTAKRDQTLSTIDSAERKVAPNLGGLLGWSF